MPAVTIANVTQPASNLAAVLQQITEAMGAIGDATPVLVGKKYIEGFGAGSAPRVLFVPEPKGKIGPPREMGNAASMTHSCDVAVRAREEGSDIGRFNAAYDLADLVVDLIDTACTGCLEWSDLRDNSPLAVDGLGADLAFSFTYRRDIPHSALRWSLAPATAASTTAVPQVPPGSPGTLEEMTVSTDPEEQ